MRDLTMYGNECLDELESIGIECGEVKEFVINTRAAKRWGQCKKLPDGTYSININVSLLDERNDEAGLKNTLYHELLHTCRNCLNHGDAWKTLANKVNRELHTNVKRTSSGEEKGVQVRLITKQVAQVQYKFRCKNCGQIIKRKKKSKFVRNYKHYICTSCGGGRFEPFYG